MKKIINILYAVCVVGMVLFFLCCCIWLKNDVFQKRAETACQQFTEYTYVEVQDENAPQGVRDEYTIQLKNVPEAGSSLAFYSIHQNIAVYIGEELVYSVQPNEHNLFGKTPGNNWNSILVYEKDEGKALRIELVPVYESSINIQPVFYFGSTLSIWRMVIRQNILSVLLAFVAVVAGLIFMTFILYGYHNPKVDKSLLMMGIFSVVIGMWKLTDVSAVALFFPHSIAAANIPFLCLMLAPIPFVLYIKEIFKNKENIWWYIPCLASALTMIVNLVLQCLNVADLRETLWTTHIIIIFLFLVVPVMLVREIKKTGWSRKTKLMMGCILFCFAGCAVDMIFYYIFNGTQMTMMGMFGMLTYIITLGMMSAAEFRKLMAYGKEAKHYAQMAYHDQLTGCYNRAAYAELVESGKFVPKGHIVVMCDLNNLKLCNDKLGHAKGDEYIKHSAKIIQDIFGNIGKCYRMGGDEFLVLIKGITVDECRIKVTELRRQSAEFSAGFNAPFSLGIACGYEMYDDGMDYDLGDTVRRADKMMYHQKFIMKQDGV